MSKQLNSRIELLSLIKPGSIGAEIGVQKGLFSKELCESGKFKEFYSIDPWNEDIPDVKYYDYGEYVNGLDIIKNNNWETQNQIYSYAKDLLKDFECNHILRETSDLASNRFEKCYFDFIYIDGCHLKECVMNDINKWLPKLKSGGILAGDDFIDVCHLHRISTFQEIRVTIEVASAVKETLGEVNIMEAKEGYKQWWIQI